jgi:hypothetical protein
VLCVVVRVVCVRSVDCCACCLAGFDSVLWRGFQVSDFVLTYILCRLYCGSIVLGECYDIV